jgi:hypothetical protein
VWPLASPSADKDGSADNYYYFLSRSKPCLAGGRARARVTIAGEETHDGDAADVDHYFIVCLCSVLVTAAWCRLDGQGKGERLLYQ